MKTDLLNLIVLIIIFFILATVIFRTTKHNMNFNNTASLIISICVSILATIGLNGHLEGSVGIVLIPYTALAVSIILMLLWLFFCRGSRRIKKGFSVKSENKRSDQMGENDIRIKDERMKK